MKPNQPQKKTTTHTEVHLYRPKQSDGQNILFGGKRGGQSPLALGDELTPGPLGTRCGA